MNSGLYQKDAYCSHKNKIKQNQQNILKGRQYQCGLAAHCNWQEPRLFPLFTSSFSSFFSNPFVIPTWLFQALASSTYIKMYKGKKKGNRKEKRQSGCRKLFSRSSQQICSKSHWPELYHAPIPRLTTCKGGWEVGTTLISLDYSRFTSCGYLPFFSNKIRAPLAIKKQNG